MKQRYDAFRLFKFEERPYSVRAARLTRGMTYAGDGISVTAAEGDWLVIQPDGGVMVYTDDAFRTAFKPSDAEADVHFRERMR